MTMVSILGFMLALIAIHWGALYLRKMINRGTMGYLATMNILLVGVVTYFVLSNVLITSSAGKIFAVGFSSLLITLTLVIGSLFTYLPIDELKIKLDLKHSPEEAWQKLSAFSTPKAWNEDVLDSQLIGAKRKGIGATRFCETYNKLQYVERITDWEEGKKLGITYDEHPFPFDQLDGEFEIDDESKTAVIKYAYVPKFSIFGAGLWSYMLKPYLQYRLEELSKKFNL